MRGIHGLVVIGGIGIGIALAAPGCGGAPSERSLRFATKRVMHLVGTNGGEAGMAVAAAGDVNGDGLDDIFVGAPEEYLGGAVYVVFGRRSPVDERLSAFRRRSFAIGGSNDSDLIGASGGGVGDFNGDGLDDVLVGGDQAAYGHRSSRTGTFIVFGKRTTTPIDLRSPKGAAVHIDGASPVGRAGDVDGDGLADVLVESGSALYVVFGRRGDRAIDPRRLGTGGFTITDTACCSKVKPVVVRASAIGDINGDRRADLAVFSSVATSGLETTTTWIVLGKGDSETVNIRTIGRHGFRIDKSVSTRDTDVDHAAGAGDVNGDGLADFVVAAPANNGGAGDHAGSVYVIFGNEDPHEIDVSRLGDSGFAIEGPRVWYQLGLFLGSIGDIDNDGLADVIVGNRHDAYVVFGSQKSSSVELSRRGGRAFHVGLPHNVTADVATAGDVNGDGRADIIVGDAFGAGESGVVDVYAFERG